MFFCRMGSIWFGIPIVVVVVVLPLFFFPLALGFAFFPVEQDFIVHDVAYKAYDPKTQSDVE